VAAAGDHVEQNDNLSKERAKLRAKGVDQEISSIYAAGMSVLCAKGSEKCLSGEHAYRKQFSGNSRLKMGWEKTRAGEPKKTKED